METEAREGEERYLCFDKRINIETVCNRLERLNQFD